MDNKLNIPALYYTLWCGKSWMIGIAALFTAVALIVSYLINQESSAVAISDRPKENSQGVIIHNSSSCVI